MPRKKTSITGDAARRRRAEKQRQRREKRRDEEVAARRVNEMERGLPVPPRTEAERSADRRTRETEEEAAARRRADAERIAARLARETEEEAAARRRTDAERIAARLARETEEEAHARRRANAEMTAQSRTQESEEETAARRRANAERTATVRAQETTEEYQRRIEVQRARAASTRQVEAAQSILEVENRQRFDRNRRSSNAFLHIARCGLRVEVDAHTCGSMDGVCGNCGGLYFSPERNTRGTYVPCCHGGKICEVEVNLPSVLKELFQGTHEHSSDFFTNIRSYNSLLSFASMGAKIEMPPGSGPYCFRIHGAIYHRTSHLHPPRPGQEQFAQIYVLDSDAALRQRMGLRENISLNEDVLRLLDATLRNVNPYARAYKMLKDFEQEVIRSEGADAAAGLRMYIKDAQVSTGEHRGRLNAPRENEVAAIFKSRDGVPPSNRDIAVHPRGGGLINISSLNPNLEPMTYVLFFPHGNSGFRVGQRFSEMEFYSHRVSARQDCFNPILFGRKLFQQYLVDAFVKVEGNRLEYLRRHQSSLRVESYRGLCDHVYRVSEEAGVRPGIPVILPSTHIGSPRNMHENYQDAMTIVRDFGKPDLFLTFTCNPKWREIEENLNPGQKAHDRPDVVARVFDIKKEALLKDLKKNHVLGRTVADIHVIEFQKRGLPHMHLLLILAEEDKVRDSEDIDAVVCAELPDPTIDPTLHTIVKNTMIHGPCGNLNPRSPCMKDGVCSKGYPKCFQVATRDNVAGYPLYRRRDDGNFVLVKDSVIDNRWVVPYNPYLSKKYNAHINVEVCSSIKSVKYLFKYVYKGHDAANVVLEESGDRTLAWDEIKSFLNARYVSAPEAVWRLFAKSMHSKSHSIIRLAVHLEDLQPVYFAESEERDAVQRAASRNTTLTGWFELNRNFPEANQFLYVEIPSHYVWNRESNMWQRRRRLGDRIVARMYSVSPRDIERFHLRLLLCHVKGAKSFADLRTYEDVQYSTFKEVCIARHLLQEDEEWKNCLTEAVAFQMPSQLRQLFCFICIFCSPTEPIALWNDFKEALSEDFARSYSEEDSINLSLRSIGEQLRLHNFTLAGLGLPEPSAVEEYSVVAQFDVHLERQEAERMEGMLNSEQKGVYTSVLQAVGDEDGDRARAFCVNAFAGAGKTFLFRTILHAVRGLGHVAIPVAYTGIAAVLLPGGRTVHSTFKLPVPLLENSSCSIRENSEDGRRLKTAKLIVWDECTMTPHYALEAVDRLLRGLTGRDVLFGGKVVVLGGDWRQTLPVTLRANRSATVESCLKNSFLWPVFTQFTLLRNMRLRPQERAFSEWLLQLGEGRLGNENGLEGDVVEIPASCVVDASLVEDIFGSMEFQMQDLADKAILCPKNEEALEMNEDILRRFPGQVHTLYSADSIVCEDEEEQDTFQMDFVHSLTPSGMPPHCLNLKVGALVMLLRNLNPSAGLCNGTRLIVKRIMRNVLDCEVISGHTAGSRVFIPRIQLSPSDSNLPFQLKRRQFPLRLAFCMTINKSQGQTLKKVGIYLPQPVFNHGMLYVAFSRCTSIDNVRVQVKDTRRQGKLIRNSNKVFTENVVYREVLQ